jgi:hypothetical protein
MNEEEVRQKMLDIVGDIYYAHAVATAPRAPFTFDGLTWKEAKDMINKAFDGLEPDHPKVKLPREVIDELNDWQSDHQDSYTGEISELCGAMWDEDPDLPAVIAFAEKSEENYLKVIDAYRYGWEAEPEAKWYVKTPEAWESEDGDFGWLYKSIYGGVDTTSHGDGEENEQFTRSELKLYHLDSDIFTLVPVEADKEVSR